MDLRAWQRDDSADLSATMAALDKALSRADGLATQFLPGKSRPVDASEPFAEPPTGTESLG